MVQIVIAIGFLHQHNVAYRNLKLENILMRESGYICLADFSLSKMMLNCSSLVQSFYETQPHMAPETICDGQVFKSSDWWMLGVLVYELISGKPPFSNKNSKMLREMICKSKRFFLISESILSGL